MCVCLRVCMCMHVFVWGERVALHLSYFATQLAKGPNGDVWDCHCELCNGRCAKNCELVIQLQNSLPPIIRWQNNLPVWLGQKGKLTTVGWQCQHYLHKTISTLTHLQMCLCEVAGSHVLLVQFYNNPGCDNSQSNVVNSYRNSWAPLYGPTVVFVAKGVEGCVCFFFGARTDLSCGSWPTVIRNRNWILPICEKPMGDFSANNSKETFLTNVFPDSCAPFLWFGNAARPSNTVEKPNRQSFYCHLSCLVLPSFVPFHPVLGVSGAGFVNSANWVQDWSSVFPQFFECFTSMRIISLMNACFHRFVRPE